jgi:LPXTG-site transpeptidase (sortase) family protein
MSVTTKTIFFIMAVAASIFLTTLVHAVWYAPDSNEVTDPGLTATSTAIRHHNTSPDDYPARLSIPKLQVDANVQKVGIAKSGGVAVPINLTDVAWYKNSSVPGQPGGALIDGHVDNGLALAGVFKHLNSLVVGDDIYVQTESGQQLHFVVSHIATYPYQEVPMGKILTPTGPSSLSLITCDGTWIQGKKTYGDRLVVYATLQ